MKLTGGLAVLIAMIAGASPTWSQDVQRGAQAFNRCRACHQIGPGARNKAGPALTGVVGRKAASVPGFNYSTAMKKAAANGLVWTDEKLAAYLESPDTFLPNGVMVFAGVKDQGQVQDIIAFMKAQR
jgi:cytochrome c